MTAVYLQEKMRLLIRKQTAIFEILNQLSGTLPFTNSAFLLCMVLLLNFQRGYLNIGLPSSTTHLLLYVLYVFLVEFLIIYSLSNMFIMFLPDTLIDISNTERKTIKDVQLGESIKNNKVLGKIYILPHYADTYNYKGVCVSGSHLVFDKKWERVEDNCNSIQDNKNTDLYCLITDNNTIYSNNIKFRDYQETQDIDINLQINHLIASSLNNNLGAIVMTTIVTIIIIGDLVKIL